MFSRHVRSSLASAFVLLLLLLALTVAWPGGSLVARAQDGEDVAGDGDEEDVGPGAVAHWRQRVALLHEQADAALDALFPLSPGITDAEWSRLRDAALSLERLVQETLTLLEQSRSIRVDAEERTDLIAGGRALCLRLQSVRVGEVDWLAGAGLYDRALAALEALAAGELSKLFEPVALERWRISPATDMLAVRAQTLMDAAERWATLTVAERAFELDLRQDEARLAATLAVDPPVAPDVRAATDALAAVKGRYADVLAESAACRERFEALWVRARQWWQARVLGAAESIEGREAADQWRVEAYWFLVHWRADDETASAEAREAAETVARQLAGLWEDHYSLSATQRYLAIAAENRDVDAAFRLVWQMELSRDLGEFEQLDPGADIAEFERNAAQDLANMLLAIDPDADDAGTDDGSGDGDSGDGDGDGDGDEEGSDDEAPITVSELAGMARLWTLRFASVDATLAPQIAALTTAAGADEAGSFVAMSTHLAAQCRDSETEGTYPTPCWAWDMTWQAFQDVWGYYRQHPQPADPEGNPTPIYQALSNQMNILVGETDLDTRNCPDVGVNRERAQAWAQLVIERVDLLMEQIFTPNHPQRSVRVLLGQHRDALQAVLDAPENGSDEDGDNGDNGR